MHNLIRLESIVDFTRRYSASARDDGLYLVSGDLLNEVRAEMEKGQRARWVLQEMIELGTKQA